MSRNMFTLYYDEPLSIKLFKILKKNKKVKCFDWVNIEKDETNECVGKVFFIEGPTIFMIDMLVDLKNEIRNVIDTVNNTDERMVLRYRYIHNYTWKQIGDELGADSRTVRRWHGKVLTHVELPENPIKI